MENLVKKGLVGVFILILILSLAACGSSEPADGNRSGENSQTNSDTNKASETNSETDNSSDNTEKANDSEPREKVIIEYWHAYSDQEVVVLEEKIKPLFEKEYPHIELKLTHMPNDGLKQQVIAAVAGDSAPDLMRMDIAWVPEFADMGALKNISSMSGFDEVKNSVFPGPMSTNRYDGDYYGVPLDTNTKVAIYNKLILEKAGLSNPPETMEELEKAARTLVDQGEMGGIGIGGTYAWGYLPYFWSLGGSIMDGDYSKVQGNLNSSESIQALEKIVSWNDEGLISPTILGGEPSTWDGIKQDNYLMIDDGPWFYSILMNDENAERDIMDYTIRSVLPAGAGGSRSVIGGQNLVAFVNSKHPEEAWIFAQWMLGKEPQNIMAETGLIPSNKEAANDPGFLQVPFVKEYVEQLETALPRPPIPQWGELEEIVNLAFEKAVRGKMSPEDALNEAAKQGEAVLKD